MRDAYEGYPCLYPMLCIWRESISHSDDAPARLAGAVKTWNAGILVYPTMLACDRKAVLAVPHANR
jgi:hypothetical protein